MAFLSACKKDVAIQNPEIEKEQTIDPYEGNYNCFEMRYAIYIDSLGHISHTYDTNRTNVIVHVSKLSDSSYYVEEGAFNFTTNDFYNGAYQSDCPAGPCPSIKFYSTDSVYVFRRQSNPVSYHYFGKKL